MKLDTTEKEVLEMFFELTATMKSKGVDNLTKNEIDLLFKAMQDIQQIFYLKYL